MSAFAELHMEQIMEPREKYVFIVSSKGEHLIRLETKKPFRMSINKIGYTVIDDDYDKIGKKMEKELKKKIQEPEVTSTIPYNSSYNPNACKSWFKNSHAPTFEEEVCVGVRALYENKELVITGLAKDEMEFLLEQYKSRRAVEKESITPSINL